MPTRPPNRLPLFLAALVAGKSQKDAAIEAGISPTNAPKWACLELAKPEVKAELDRMLAAVASKSGKTREKWLERMWEIFDESDNDRVAAGDKIAKAMRWYPADRLEHTGKDGVPLVLQIDLTE